MRALQLVVAVAVAFLVQTLGGQHLPGLTRHLDLFLVTAASFGLAYGRVAGLGAGTVAGLTQDAFSGGMLGLNGLAKTTVGYLAGALGHRLILNGWLVRFAFFALASALDTVILALVGAAVDVAGPRLESTRALSLCVGNGVAGIVFSSILERWRRAG